MSLNVVDLGNAVGIDTDLGEPDWGRTIQRVLTQPALVPTGTADEPTVVRIPEMLRCVSSIEPYRAAARHVWLIADKGAGLSFPTLGPGHDGSTDYVAAIEKDPSTALGYKNRFRTRFGLGPVGGHGWKYSGKLIGPKQPGMPLRSPSGPGARNCLEGQHAFWGKDFGYDLTDDDIDNGVHGWDICATTIAGWWGDAFSPSPSMPNGKPCRELHVFGGHFSDLGRIGLLATNLAGWSIREAEFGTRIPSSLIHVEPNTKNEGPLIGGGVFERNVIRGGANLFHVTGDYVNFDGLLVRANERWDSCVGGRIMVGPRKADGTARARNVQVIDNLHHTIRDGMMLGDYVNVDHVQHQRNVGPMRKGWATSQLLRSRGGTNVTLAPNAYRFVPR